MALSTDNDNKSSLLPSSIKSTSQSKEKMHNQVTQTTVVIEDPNEAERIFSDLVNDANEEILIMFPSIGALTRERLFTKLLNRQRNENIED